MSKQQLNYPTMLLWEGNNVLQILRFALLTCKHQHQPRCKLFILFCWIKKKKEICCIDSHKLNCLCLFFQEQHRWTHLNMVLPRHNRAAREKTMADSSSFPLDYMGYCSFSNRFISDVEWKIIFSVINKVRVVILFCLCFTVTFLFLSQIWFLSLIFLYCLIR